MSTNDQNITPATSQRSDSAGNQFSALEKNSTRDQLGSSVGSASNNNNWDSATAAAAAAGATGSSSSSSNSSSDRCGFARLAQQLQSHSDAMEHNQIFKSFAESAMDEKKIEIPRPTLKRSSHALEEDEEKMMDDDQASVPSLKQAKANSQGCFFHNTKYLMTWPGHLNKESLKQFMKDKNGGEEPKALFIAHENADKNNPYKHTHATVWFKKNFQHRSERYLDYDGKFDVPHVNKEGKEVDTVHPNIEVVGPSKEDWDNVCSYISKEDTQVGYQQGKLSKWIDKIQKQPNLNAALRQANKMNELSIIPQIFAMKAAKFVSNSRISISMFKGWQKELYNMLEAPGTPGGRVTVWVWNPQGAVGKTQFCLALRNERAEDYLILDNYVSIKDLTGMIERKQREGWNGTRIIMELSKRETQYTSVYNNIEKMRGGSFTSGKFQGGQTGMRVEHAVVLSNEPPDVKGLTRDKWLIYEVVQLDGKDLEEAREYDEKTQEEWERNRIINTKLKRLSLSEVEIARQALLFCEPPKPQSSVPKFTLEDDGFQIL